MPVLFFISRLFEGVNPPALVEYGGRYFPFLLLGFAFQDYLSFSQSTFNASIREHQLMGTLEIVMLSPTPVSLVLLFSSLWGYIFTSLRFGVYLLCGIGLGLDLSRANFRSFAVLAFVSVLSFASLGIILAAVTVTIKRSEAVTTLIGLTSAALSGVFYPISVLPARLQWLAQALPFTHSLSAMRRALMQGATLSQLSRELGILAAFSVVLFPLGLSLFHLAISRAKVNGTLSQY